MTRPDGFDWDGETAVVTRAAPAGASDTPGWTRLLGARLEDLFLGRSTGAFLSLDMLGRRMTQGALMIAVLTLVAALAHGALHWVSFAVVAAQGALLAAIAADALLAAVPRGVLYHLAWDADGVTVTRGRREADIPVAAIREVGWEPQPWYGLLARRPVGLGANVVLRRLGEPDLLVARGLDPGRLRALAERLARDLRVPLREDLPVPIAREPAALNRPLVLDAAPLPPPGHAFRLAAWQERETPEGLELTLAAGFDLPTLFTHVFAAENVLLPPLLAYDFVRYGVLTAMYGPQALLVGWLHGGVLDVLLHLVVGGSFVAGFARAARPRRIVVGREAIVAEAGGVEVGRIRIAALEQVRAEAFPSPAVRLVGDRAEVLLPDLPSRLDAEALADRLPRVLRER